MEESLLDAGVLQRSAKTWKAAQKVVRKDEESSVESSGEDEDEDDDDDDDARLIGKWQHDDNRHSSLVNYVLFQLSVFFLLIVAEETIFIYGSAPTYLSRLVRVADLPGRRSVRSARSNHLLVPSVRLSTVCLLYTSPSPRDRTRSRMPSSA